MVSYGAKKEALRRSGVLSLGWRTAPSGLYVFNYHRVGVAADTAFDSEVFSCDVQHFRRQLNAIGENFRFIEMDELVSLVRSRKRIDERLAMITFDDGYRDNFTEAFPVLVELGVPATFFLPTGFIGACKVPWWDEIAWLVKNTTQSALAVDGWLPHVVVQGDRRLAVRRILDAFKLAQHMPADAKVQSLREATGCALLESDKASLFLSWDDVLTMATNGMTFGSHSHSHQILSHLDAKEQQHELAISKEILESRLNTKTLSVAYPVGGIAAYDAETRRAALRCGYELGFNFIEGFNRQPWSSPFDLLRIAVEDNAEPADIQYSTLRSLFTRLRSSTAPV